ncbi:hypothetical protein WICPIJ_006972, partial [Wickerhamomyces pijperi]
MTLKFMPSKSYAEGFSLKLGNYKHETYGSPSTDNLQPLRILYAKALSGGRHTDISQTANLETAPQLTHTYQTAKTYSKNNQISTAIMFSFLKRTKTHDSATTSSSTGPQNSQHHTSSLLQRVKSSTSTQNSNNNEASPQISRSKSTRSGSHSDSIKPRSKSFNISKLFLNELQESHRHDDGSLRRNSESSVLSMSEDDSGSDSMTTYPINSHNRSNSTSGGDLNLSLSRFTSINQDKFAPRLLSLLHSKGLSNPFIISENKELKLSFSSNGEYIFLPSLQGNEEDDDDSNGQTHDNHYEDEDPVVFNFAVILS